MTTLVVIVAVLCAGAVITFIGTRHIERIAELAVVASHVKVVELSGFGHMLHHAAADRVVAGVEELVGGK